MRTELGLGILAVPLALAMHATAGEIVVGHDINTFSTSLDGAVERQYALNIANHLTGGSGDILLIESAGDPLRDFSAGMISTLEGAGYGVTLDAAGDGYASEINNLDSYDAVFFSVEFGTDLIPDVALLHDFMNSGGGAYVAGGVGPNALAEAQSLNQFLAPYGVMFRETNGYNRSLGFNVTEEGGIFEGLAGEFIRASNGSAIVSMGLEDADAQVFFDDRDGFAQVSLVSIPAVPAPGAAALLGLGALAGTRRRR